MRAPRALYPATLDLGDATVVVVGAGAVALRKLKGLPKGVKRVRVVAPRIGAGVKALAKTRPEFELIQRGFEGADLRNCRLLFCCADDPDVNAFAARQAKALGAWICQSADGAEGDLKVPAVVSAGGLQLTLSTGGASPALAKALRIHFESRLKASDLKWFLGRLESLRPKLKADPRLKARLMRRLADPKVAARALNPKSKDGRRFLQDLLKP